ncbi:MAG: RHS repeat-associated core domain-containing protein [Rhodanobacter sp.]
MTVGGTVHNVASTVTYRGGDRAMAGWVSSNGLANNLSYDGDGRLTAIMVPTLQNLAFTYDAADRISSITNGMNGTLTQSFQYDALSRLTAVTSGAGNQSFQYDPSGNRTVQTGKVNTIGATNNRLTSSGTTQFGYDVQGNTTSVDGVLTYHYDAFNRMDSAGGMSYYVNPEGQRLRKTGNTGTTFFATDASGPLLAERPNGNWVDYVWLNGRLIGRVANGQIYAIHDDQVGRPEAVTDASRNVVWQAQNLAFTQNVTVASIALNVGFPGQYYDAETGKWNNGFRDYDSGTGRYLQSDPIGLMGGINTYVYVGSNPVSGIDLLGLCTECGNQPTLPNGVSVKANIQYMQVVRRQVVASGDPFYTGLFSTFFHLVKYGGDWDYKTQNTYPGQYDDGGNFNYGATGAAAGISTQLLSRAAGAAQMAHSSSNFAWAFPLGPFGGAPYGDQPMDQAAIKAGIAYYQCLVSGGK